LLELRCATVAQHVLNGGHLARIVEAAEVGLLDGTLDLCKIYRERYFLQPLATAAEASICSQLQKASFALISQELVLMDTQQKRQQLATLAEEVFELGKLGSRFRAASRRDDDSGSSLTETETLALDLLDRQGEMTVGEIQKGIGVLPAQMSRIVRSLEDKGGEAYIKCTINPQDRRKIDVVITPAGRKALSAYREERLGATMKVLSILEPPERDELMRIFRKISAHLSKSVK
jgi:DNA-binding MarR family transcriptional regulator